MEAKENNRNPLSEDMPGLINRDGKPIIELLDEAFAPVQEAEPARRRTIGELYSQKKATDEIGQLRSLSIQFGIPLLAELPIDHMSVDFTRKIPIQYLKKQKIVPLETPDAFLIAVSDPSNFQAVDDLMRIVGRHDAEVVLSSEGTILSAIGHAYDLGRDSAQEFTEIMNGESADSIISEIEETADLLDEASDAPIIKLVNLVLAQAIKDRASDIHIEPYAGSLKIRYRIDGMLYNLLNLPRRIQSSLVSRIKIMAKLNIAEKRLPQDGRIEVRIGDKNVDIRVSVIPTAFGERVVLRLLDKSQALLTLADLGLDATKIKLFDRLIKSPYGIVLVTGPTGSGKTTSLYAALSKINSPEINIITIEDPIEYQIEGIGQIQVNPKIDLTFATGLRSIVRQDPDVILVGEIRDRETAEIAIQSSLTGHLVFSTLHTNDAASAITRLIDMGIEPFLVSSSVIAIVAQRLVRVLCPRCKEAYQPDAESLIDAGIPLSAVNGRQIFQRRGCNACMNTGYRGRTGIFEIMNMDEGVKKLILKTSDSNQINEEAVRNGMSTLVQDGARKVLEGVTTIEEVLRVTRVLNRNSNVVIEDETI
ncbi:MAG TPA: type II secretion system ATPase GspE [Syntrophales bacterium]|nr:type II secretion system ATPase GspE [Syntrophales bacterium]